jgi:hypothetical protein
MDANQGASLKRLATYGLVGLVSSKEGDDLRRLAVRTSVLVVLVTVPVWQITGWVAGLTVAVIAWAIALAAIRVTERA